MLKAIFLRDLYTYRYVKVSRVPRTILGKEVHKKLVDFASEKLEAEGYHLFYEYGFPDGSRIDILATKNGERIGVECQVQVQPKQIASKIRKYKTDLDRLIFVVPKNEEKKLKTFKEIGILTLDIIPRQETQAVTTRLGDELLEEIEEIAREESVDRSSAIQRLLKIGLKEYRMKKAINLYRDGKVTLWKAAEIAGVSLREMMDAIKARDIPYQYDFEALGEYVDELLAKRKTIDA